ncbi:hypothetical protein GALMADRAFT_1356487 [Galerina marginata CBS 339.88]|uniref:Uncharacterized protein n=1 Tax=Galerina marginata (strain CBS 339.88) TaxID=685588 RepID=A0A067SBY3_GALM3|nr:hypothetical protein GALMADRAFT_1356487 [Galerina marginata CBS 339.88]
MIHANKQDASLGWSTRCISIVETRLLEFKGKDHDSYYRMCSSSSSSMRITPLRNKNIVVGLGLGVFWHLQFWVFKKKVRERNRMMENFLIFASHRSSSISASPGEKTATIRIPEWKVEMHCSQI